jgi:hypothetical protein
MNDAQVSKFATGNNAVSCRRDASSVAAFLAHGSSLDRMARRDWMRT